MQIIINNCNSWEKNKEYLEHWIDTNENCLVAKKENLNTLRMSLERQRQLPNCSHHTAKNEPLYFSNTIIGCAGFYLLFITKGLFVCFFIISTVAICERLPDEVPLLTAADKYNGAQIKGILKDFRGKLNQSVLTWIVEADSYNYKDYCIFLLTVSQGASAFASHYI